MDLSQYSVSDFDRGRGKGVEAFWYVVNALLMSSWLPGSFWRALLIRSFGAKVGRGVVIKPGVRIKFPWKLEIGDFSWIGEDVWIDNVFPIRVGRSVCISQGAYLCSGNHDWRDYRFTLRAGPIEISDSAWVCAKAVVCPGAVIGTGVVLLAGAVASGVLETGLLYGGNPAQSLGRRVR